MLQSKKSYERVTELRKAVRTKMTKLDINIDDLRQELNLGLLHEKNKVSFSTLWRFLDRNSEPKGELALALSQWAKVK